MVTANAKIPRVSIEAKMGIFTGENCYIYRGFGP